MNEDMKAAWLEITQMLGETTREELDVFLRTWQRAVEATKRQAVAEAEQVQPVGEVLNERGEVDWISFVPAVGTSLYAAHGITKENT